MECSELSVGVRRYIRKMKPILWPLSHPRETDKKKCGFTALDTHISSQNVHQHYPKKVITFKVFILKGKINTYSCPSPN